MTFDFKAVLFDLDGVLIDTEGIYSKFWEKIGIDYQVPYPDFSDRIKGTTLPQILNNYFPVEKHNEIVAQLEVFEDAMSYQIFPGVEDFLKFLKLKDIPCAIVTSSGGEKMKHLWEQHPHFKDYFSVIISDKDVTKSKPDPQPYLVAAKALGIDIKKCIVFEDSFNGILSGQRSGATVIALSTTNPRDELLEHTPNVISSFSDLF